MGKGTYEGRTELIRLITHLLMITLLCCALPVSALNKPLFHFQYTIVAVLIYVFTFNALPYVF